MKYLTLLAAALVFAGSAAAVDCTDCHEPIDQATHVEAEATLGTCNDCHGFSDAHEMDMELHEATLTMAECADCHGM
ncbi:hypothetical protein [Shewanella woodyi]|uniref:Uncharacterized protein n=1 Tax=Shewanella woodyi (strain ATCC 51908 / MS32) TaxID=392500 RepID=B1KE15_SHEWM|nr:hypothetical protein [Shewanella woodyi]ACA88017.1 conserved hypothetical protein [Shewanella woodyi ATCC 51908]